jgi:hypothetical protein
MRWPFLKKLSEPEELRGYIHMHPEMGPNQLTANILRLPLYAEKQDTWREKNTTFAQAQLVDIIGLFALVAVVLVIANV